MSLTNKERKDLKYKCAQMNNKDLQSYNNRIVHELMAANKKANELNAIRSIIDKEKKARSRVLKELM